VSLATSHHEHRSRRARLVELAAPAAGWEHRPVLVEDPVVALVLSASMSGSRLQSQPPQPLRMAVRALSWPSPNTTLTTAATAPLGLSGRGGRCPGAAAWTSATTSRSTMVSSGTCSTAAVTKSGKERDR
jgi:hypothetical protein